MMAKVTSKPNGNGTAQVDADAPEEKQEKKTYHSAIPRPASHNCTPEQLIEYWKGINKEFRQRVWGYLYRDWPIIVRPPKKHFIDKLNEPLESIDPILQQWGTGEYEIRLLDMDRTEGRPLCKARWKFKESFTEYPPVLDVLELDYGCKDNEVYIQWLRSKGMLRMPGDAPGSSQADSIAVKALADIATKKQEPQETMEGEAATAAFKIMGSATEAAIKTVQAQSDPTAILKLVEALKGKDEGNSGIVAAILKMQADIQAQQLKFLEMIVSLSKPQGNALSQVRELAELVKSLKEPTQGSPLGNIRELAETVGSLRDVFGGEGGRRGDKWWHAALDNPAVNRALDSIGGAFMNWSQAQLWARRQMQLPPQPGLEPAPAPAPDAGTIPGVAPATTAAQPPNEEAMNLAALGAFLQPRFPAFMEALDSGISGAEFAQELFETRPSLGGMDLGTHAQIKAIGRDKILSLLGMAPPEVKALLAGKQTMLVQFLDDFLAWVPEKEEVPLPGEFPGERT